MNQIKLKTKINPPTQCLQIGNSAIAESLPSLSGAHCVGGFSILGENRMKTHPQTELEQPDIQSQAQIWERRQVERDSKRFEQYTLNDVSQALARRGYYNA